MVIVILRWWHGLDVVLLLGYGPEGMGIGRRVVGRIREILRVLVVSGEVGDVEAFEFLEREDPFIEDHVMRSDDRVGFGDEYDIVAVVFGMADEDSCSGYDGELTSSKSLPDEYVAV